MLERYFSKQTIQILFLIGYCLVAVGLPFSKIILSLATMYVFLLTLLNFRLRHFILRIKLTPELHWLGALLLWFLLSRFWSDDGAWFMHDFNIKLPLFALPLVISLHPVKKATHLRILLSTFVAAVSVAALYNLISWYGWRSAFHTDIRELSYFGSHIRFGLMIVFALILCTFQLFTNYRQWHIPAAINGLFLLFYTFYAGVFNAYIAILITGIGGLIWLTFKSYSRRKAFTITGAGLVILLSGALAFYFTYLKPPPPLNSAYLNQRTAEGNRYEHFPESRYYVNGHHMYSFICEPELQRDWFKRTGTALFDTDSSGTPHYYPLLHYMTARGLRKDAAGLRSLSDAEIASIKMGSKDSSSVQTGFGGRINDLRKEFYDDNPNGKSLLQRLAYLKTGWHIFTGNPLIGVGAGDVCKAFEEQYAIENSRLLPENRLRAHNQYLTFFITLGIPGGLLFLIFLITMFRRFIRRSDWPASMFLILLMLSFVSEDTLETQIGVTFFAFFAGIFLHSNLNLLSNITHENRTVHL